MRQNICIVKLYILHIEIYMRVDLYEADTLEQVQYYINILFPDSLLKDLGYLDDEDNNE